MVDASYAAVAAAAGVTHRSPSRTKRLFPPNRAGLPRPANMLIEQRVRSGQSIICLEGDVTIVGSVASGAEVIAGGSIHVYGALCGRAIAGATIGPKAQIFCTQDGSGIDCHRRRLHDGGRPRCRASGARPFGCGSTMTRCALAHFRSETWHG